MLTPYLDTIYLTLRICQADLLLDEGHDADSSEDRLPTQPLPRDAVGKRLGPVGHRLAQVTHKKRHVSSGGEEEEDRKLWLKERNNKSFCLNIFLCIRFLLEFFLRLAPEVSDQPLRGKGVLRWHPPAHHCVQESLSLACVKAQHLSMEITAYFRYYGVKLALSVLVLKCVCVWLFFC